MLLGVMMLGMQIIILSIILLIVPAVIGMGFVSMEQDRVRLPFAWVGGQMILWAGFLLISVPLILLEKSFTAVIILFSIYTVALLVAAIIIYMQRRTGLKQAGLHKSTVEKCGKNQCLLWIIFAALLLFQLVMTVCMAYEEGDDAFYVAISTATASSETMYQILPYTGFGTGLDARHGLAPFPVWVAYLARLSGMPAVSVAQVALPVAIVGMTYAIYYLLAMRLLADHKKNVPFFMILVEILYLFGGYSVYTTENFLLVRASQGKAVIANIVIPFLLYLLLLLLDKVQQKEKAGWSYWLLLAAAMATGCLCSTQGTILTCMLIGIVGICTAVSYRKWTILIPLALCSVIPVVIVFMYFVLR